MSAWKALAALADLEGVEVAADVALAQNTTYRIGGPADLMVTAHTYAGLVRALRVLAVEGVPWVVMVRVV